MKQLDRRGFLGSVAGASFFVAVAGAQGASAATTVSLASYGSVNSSDNTQALLNAINAAGPGGTVSVPNGTWRFAGRVNVNSPVTLMGGDLEACIFSFSNDAYGLCVNGGAKGTKVHGIGFKSTGGATSSYIQPVTDTEIRGCGFAEPAMYAINPCAAGINVTVTLCMFIGTGVSKGVAINASSRANLTVDSCGFSGLDGGVYAAGAGNIIVKNSVFWGMWYYGNKALCAGTVGAGSTATTLAATSSIDASKINDLVYATVTAWTKVATSVTVTPVAGKSGWFTLSRVAAPQARMLISTPAMSAIILRVEGNQVYAPAWFNTTTLYPLDGNLTDIVKIGCTVERPIVGRLDTPPGTSPKAAISGASAKVVSWHAGDKGTNEVPPAGARFQINPKSTYQCYSTAGTSSFTVTSNTMVAVWADSISCMGGVNADVQNNTIYDGQDVSITLEMITGSARATGNTAYRSGTAMVYAGSPGVVVSSNVSHGANMMTDNAPSYSAFTVQGAPNASLTNNTAIYGGAPWERSGISIDGYDGEDNTSPATQQQGPWATNVLIQSNTITGYPLHDVTMWGTKASVRSGSTWKSTPRLALSLGATRAMMGL